MIDTYEVVKKLIGPIMPIGGTNEGNDIRRENLKKMIATIDSLLKDIGYVARYSKDRHVYGTSKSGKIAHTYLVNKGIDDY